MKLWARPAPANHGVGTTGTARPPPALPAPAGQATGAAPSETLDALLERFAGLQRRLKEKARYDGLDDDGPMTLVIELLQLCMATLCRVTSLNVQTTERHAAQVVGTLEEARRGAEAAMGQAKTEIERHMADRSDWFALGIGDRLTSNLKAMTQERINQVPLNTTLWVGALLVAASLAAGWGIRSWWGFDIEAVQAATRAVTTETVVAALRDTRDHLNEAIFRDGRLGAQHWLNLMQWNAIRPALAQCSTNPGLVITEADGRVSCTVPLWITAPGSTQPMVPVPQPAPAPQPAPPAQQAPSLDNPNRLGLKPPRIRP